jgi:hypothetical protein
VTGVNPEQRLAEALRAQASGAAGRPGRGPGTPRRTPSPAVLLPLLIALLAGVALGVVLALLSVQSPGLLPNLG